MNRKLKASGIDNRTVDILDPYALEFWTTEFKVTEKKLKAAVLVAGKVAYDIKRELKNK